MNPSKKKEKQTLPLGSSAAYSTAIQQRNNELNDMSSPTTSVVSLISLEENIYDNDHRLADFGRYLGLPAHQISMLTHLDTIIGRDPDLVEEYAGKELQQAFRAILSFSDAAGQMLALERGKAGRGKNMPDMPPELSMLAEVISDLANGKKPSRTI